MRKMSLKEQKLRMLEIMDHIHNFCEENGFHYNLLHGTLIGAVRHKGFIPWDDDLDIALLRDEYDRFVQEYPQKNTNERFKLVCVETEEEFYSPFAKIIDMETVLHEWMQDVIPIGVYVDIFALENAGDDIGKAIKWQKEMRKYKLLLQFKQVTYATAHSWWKGLIVLFARPIMFFVSRRWVLKKMIELARRFQNTDSHMVCNILVTCGLFRMYPLIEKEIYENRMLLDFEGRKFYAPRNYDKILRAWYGDYMTPPPESERVTPHFYDLWHKDRSLDEE